MDRTRIVSSESLPHIQIVGGDNTPWRIQLYKESDRRCAYDDVAGYRCKLTLKPFLLEVQIGENGNTETPVLQKDGTITKNPDGSAYAEFTFAHSDTLALRGRYLYQIEFICGSSYRIGQGVLHVTQNMNR